MNLLESEKERFNEQWWRLLSHHFSLDYMKKIYTRIKLEASRGYKIVPSSNDIYQRFKLITPEDVRIVFLLDKPIGIYEQSTEWQLISRWIENEAFDGLHLNMEDNMDYLIPQGIISLSPSLTICNKSDHSNIGWEPFYMDVINILAKSPNKILTVIGNDKSYYSINMDYSIKLEEGCITKINQFMQTEYNTKINW